MTAARWVATGFGLGYLRPAPGTWGSAGALIVGLGIVQFIGFPALVLATFAASVAGFWACAAELKDRPGADPSEFVIDEIAGQWLTLLFPAFLFWRMGMDDWILRAYPGWVAAFIFFRIFDIWKPWLVGRADRRGDPAGVMLDDLWAGIFAGFSVILAGGLAHLPMILG